MIISIKKRIPSALLLVIGLFAQTADAQQILTLEQCRQLALERNNNIKLAQQNINVAKSQKAQADLGGKFTIDGSATAFHFGKPLNRVLPSYGVSPSVSINQPVYSGGKTDLAKASALKGVEIQEEQKELTTSEVLYNTERAYWQVVSAGERIKLAEQNQKQLNALFEDLNNQFTAGITYKNDVLRSKVQQNANELNLTKAKDAELLAKLNLAQIIGLAEGSNFSVSDSISGSFNVLKPRLAFEEVPDFRSEVRILQKSLETEKIQEKVLKADFKPSVNFSLSGLSAFGDAGINPSSAGNNFMASYYTMLSLNIPIFDWGKRKQKVQQQQFRISAQEIQLKERKEQISLEVQQAYMQLNQSARRIELSGASLEQADENLRLSKDRLKSGTIVGKDVLEAQTLWLQAYNDVIDAKVEYKINEANLKRVLGNK